MEINKKETLESTTNAALPRYLLVTKASCVTSNPTRLVRLLCKHFSRKVDALWDEDLGFVQFAEGVCVMKASGEALGFHCAANNKADLAAIVDTIDRHLSGFSGADDIMLNWSC